MLIKSCNRMIAASLVILVAETLTLEISAAEPYARPIQTRQNAIRLASANMQTCNFCQQQCRQGICPNCQHGRVPWASFDDTWMDGWRIPNIGQKLHGLYCRKKRRQERFRDYMKKRFGYFNPTGCCRGGCAPYGGYKLIYPTNPRRFDPRDGRIYAAPTTGIPVTVPLAPNVRYQWNYGHGIPSSRLTPISTIVPAQRPNYVQ